MSNSWALTTQYSDGAALELLSSSSASRREPSRIDLDGGSSSSLSRNLRNGRIAVILAAFASIVAILFLVSHCVSLSRDALPKHTGRRLAGGEQATKKHGSGNLVQEACGGEGSESGTATGRHGISAEPSEADAPAGWSVYGEPPKKKKKEVLEEQLETSRIPSDVVDRSVAPTQTGGAAEELRQSILQYVEQTLAEGNEGVEPEDWLLEPYMGMQFLDDEELSKSVSTSESAVAGPTDAPGSSGHTAVAQHLPEEGTAGSASPVEGSLQCSKSSVDITSPTSGVLFSPRGAIMQLREHLLAAQTASKKALLFKCIVGQPGTKGAYMLLASEISNFKGRPALAIFSSPLSGESVSQQIPRKQDMRTHPFFRLPSVSVNASVRDIVLKRWPMSRQRTVCESRALLGIKELFKKPFLDSKDLEHLMTHLEQLVEYSIYRAKENIGRLSPKYIVAKLGYALLVTDAIYAASEVLGTASKRPQWWQQVIDTLPVYMGPPSSAAPNEKARQNMLLARFLHSALEFYRCGARPPASALVPLKQILLCSPAVPALRRGPWAHFMADDTEWQLSQ